MTMDKRKISLLKYLLRVCGDECKVIDTNVVLSKNKAYKSYEQIKKDIDFFAQRRYIDLKYIDKDNICLCMLDNSRILQENLKIESNIVKKFVTMLLIFTICSLVTSFIGAGLAMLIFRG